jgi:hypothetical protein
MGYWMHVYAQSDEPVVFKDLRKRLLDDYEFDVKLEVSGGREKNWTQLHLTHPDDWGIALIEKEPVAQKKYAGYLEEAIEEVRHTQPLSAVRWLERELPKTKVIYAFQILSGTDRDEGWNAVWAVQDFLTQERRGLLYAEAEGFSNFEGHHITWEFSSSVRGPWNMAVLDPATWLWLGFRMDLGNAQHRQAFREGRLPDGFRGEYPLEFIPHD